MAIKLFLSYCHRDEKHRERLCVHLASLKQQGQIADWHDRRIVGGQDWEAEINNQLLTADIVLLLISADFIASEYCYSREMQIALEREKRNEAVVIPIVVKPCDWKGAPFGYLQALPKDARPVTKWPNRDDAWSRVVEGIRAAVELLKTPAVVLPTRTLASTLKATPPAPTAIDRNLDACVAAEARAILPNAVTLADTDMSFMFKGAHPSHGSVILKILKVTAPESSSWLSSEDYRMALGNRLVDTGQTHSGRLFSLLRFIPGQCLSAIVRPRNVIRGALLDDVTMQLLRQLAALNRINPDAVHRDVTPSNVIFSVVDGRAVVSLIDYESGCFAGQPQQAMRAYGYSAPEQAEGRAVPSSDLFSLVSTLYFCAEGKIASLAAATTRKFSEGTFGDFTEFDELYGAERLALCWQSDPDKRPASAEEFLSKEGDPSTSWVLSPAEMGTFVCGDTTIDLFNQRYEVRS